MSTTDLGESLVGAYLRHVVGCEVVIYNSFFRGEHGEVDVVGVQSQGPGEKRLVYLCEVTTHIRGMEIVRNGKNDTVAKVIEKLDRLRKFADLTFPDEEYRYQWWSPYVPRGRLTTFFDERVAEFSLRGEELEFVINRDYTDRVQALLNHAKSNTATTSEPAYRMLQILTHLRGGKLQL
jgi:hypothetical protein